MHELSLAIPIGEYVLQESQGRNVEEIVLKVGRLSGIVPEALDLALQVVLQASCAEKACITYEWQDGEGQCRFCHTRFSMKDVLDVCPDCGQMGAKILAGTQIRLIGLRFAPRLDTSPEETHTTQMTINNS
ncbi:hydrogenase maturation nickel metallochaperone HypA [Sulfobacillus thermosulfidooxidans]|uniref:hydrogenase maturation nickel metallochaperone HypA/HybF n=1 Tax=Sulfobacillus thermosulfidooxidans TaxID=28034 RepID=UPI0006B562E7|nr:hydrogenase maturation nickel metallochaperone HypA [Sulfobacillus thermosulfidooxidans]